jgi:UDP-N-acetyl-D-glucosamine/UDP-N-acetyl-D-galactosamine dehydrogenase
MMQNLRKCRIAVLGLGYVGLPLAVEFGRRFTTVGQRGGPRLIATGAA